MFTPQGVFVAMMTPFSQEGCLDEGTLRKLVDFLVEKECMDCFRPAPWERVPFSPWRNA